MPWPKEYVCVILAMIPAATTKELLDIHWQMYRAFRSGRIPFGHPTILAWEYADAIDNELELRNALPGPAAPSKQLGGVAV